MINWGSIVKERLLASGIRVLIESCYLDNGWHLLSLLKPGMGYDKVSKLIIQTDADDPAGVTAEEVTI